MDKISKYKKFEKFEFWLNYSILCQNVLKRYMEEWFLEGTIFYLPKNMT